MIPPLPWFVFSFIHTGSPVYPLFGVAASLTSYWQFYNPIFLIKSLITTFAYSPDPIHPLFLASLPFLILMRKKLMHHVFILLFLTIGGLLMWYLTPQTGGGRYILPYLSVFTILIVYTLTLLSKRWQMIFVMFILICSVISIGYRALANEKFIPVILNRETKGDFMAKYLQYNLGDFYDIDGYFTKNIKSTDTVLLYGFHNLYYIDFPFIHTDWVQKGDLFNYVAVQGKGMPERFKYWDLVYFNTTTQVRLYSMKGQKWRY
jgi:hypothetical protein